MTQKKPTSPLFFFLSILCNKVLCIPSIIYTYRNVVEPIDVVIPCAEKDIVTLNACIQGIRTHGKNIRRIIVVSAKPLTQQAEWFDENKYPFSPTDIAREIFQDISLAEQFLQEPHSRIGWIYQQLLKLYAPLVIPDISPHVLILDSDTIFLRSVAFINSKGQALYNPGTEFHLPYFNHMQRLLPGLHRVFQAYSGISNHMLFQRPILEQLFLKISHYHSGIEPWQAICRCINPQEAPGACMSEYEIYFNFAFLQTDQVKIRPLKWEHQAYEKYMKRYLKENYDYVSCHSYLR